jgi:hypothetical protein
MTDARRDTFFLEAIKLNEAVTRTYEARAQVLAGAWAVIVPITETLSRLGGVSRAPVELGAIALLSWLPILACFHAIAPIGGAVGGGARPVTIFPERSPDRTPSWLEATGAFIGEELEIQLRTVSRVRCAKRDRFDRALLISLVAAIPVAGLILF